MSLISISGQSFASGDLHFSPLKFNPTKLFEDIGDCRRLLITDETDVISVNPHQSGVMISKIGLRARMEFEFGNQPLLAAVLEVLSMGPAKFSGYAELTSLIFPTNHPGSTGRISDKTREEIMRFAASLGKPVQH